MMPYPPTFLSLTNSEKLVELLKTREGEAVAGKSEEGYWRPE